MNSPFVEGFSQDNDRLIAVMKGDGIFNRGPVDKLFLS